MRAAYQAGKSNVPYLGTKFDDNDVYYLSFAQINDNML